MTGTIMFNVYLNDTGQHYDNLPSYWNTIDQWARDHCDSYLGHHVQDVSDVSLYWDEIAEYRFSEEKDAMLFELKWKKG